VAPGLESDWFAKHDLHIHVPAGATPKDGPSAGITIATAIVSLISGRRVRDDVAMTGEITLTGQVLPIGGLKEKALAAQRNGLTTVIAPGLNAPDVEDIPEHLLARMDLVFVSEIGEVLERALEPLPRPAAINGDGPRRARTAASGRRAAAPAPQP
jgi:ATP-dependent Lon protease